jgi:hypothetical protein
MESRHISQCSTYKNKKAFQVLTFVDGLYLALFNPPKYFKDIMIHDFILANKLKTLQFKKCIMKY